MCLRMCTEEVNDYFVLRAIQSRIRMNHHDSLSLTHAICLPIFSFPCSVGAACDVVKDIQWSQELDSIFISNYQKDPTLSWQFFGSSLGFMRRFPGKSISLPLQIQFLQHAHNIWFCFVLFSHSFDRTISVKMGSESSRFIWLPLATVVYRSGRQSKRHDHFSRYFWCVCICLPSSFGCMHSNNTFTFFFVPIQVRCVASAKILPNT